MNVLTNGITAEQVAENDHFVPEYHSGVGNMVAAGAGAPLKICLLIQVASKVATKMLATILLKFSYHGINHLLVGSSCHHADDSCRNRVEHVTSKKRLQNSPRCLHTDNWRITLAISQNFYSILVVCCNTH